MGKLEVCGLKVLIFYIMGLIIIKVYVKDFGLKLGFLLFDDKDLFVLLNDLMFDIFDGDKD